MQKIDAKLIGKIIAIAMFTGLASTVTAAPLATMDDYDWVIIKTPIDPETYQYDCHHDYNYETYNALQNCLYHLREEADNKRSRQWGIIDKVVREKNAIYIKVPNRKNPLVFIDYSTPDESDYEAHYSLEHYDKSRQLLTIHQSLYESETLTVVSLATGFWQNFDLRKLSVSPDMTFIVGFESEPGITEDISIWERQDQDYYHGYYKRVYGSEVDEKAIKARRDFYQAQEVQSVYNAETITWINDNAFNVDFFYKLNPDDSAALRVRYTFKRNPSNGKWQLLEGNI